MKLIFYIFLFVPTFSLAQITFFNSYGGQGNDYGKSIVTTIDTGYAIVGATESFGNGNTDLYLFKIDSLGNMEWSKTFGGTNVDWGMDLKQTIDTGYILCGYSNSFSWDYDVYLVKTDKNGDSLWSRRYGGSDWDFAYSVINTSDTCYVIAGETYSYGSGLSDGYAIKLNNFGDTLWTKTFGGVGKDVFNDVIETSGGDFLFAGSTTVPGRGTDFWLVKTDNLGNDIWQYTSGDSLNEVINSVVEVSDSNYFFIGDKESIVGTNLRMSFQKISQNGVDVLGNYIDYANDENGKYIQQYKNTADVYVGGSTSSLGNGGFDIHSYKITSTGFGIIFRTDGTYLDDVTENADTTADRGVVIVGTTSGTVNGIKSVFVMKEDSALNASSIINEIFDVTLIPTLSYNESFSVFPNPAKNEIKIKWGQEVNKKDYEIYNLLGELIHYGQTTGSIDVTNLKEGMYFITLSGLSEKSIKFTKL